MRCASHARLRAGQSQSARCERSDWPPTCPPTEPTTEGVIAALERHDLTGRRVGVQLYPGNANERLLKFLEGAGAQGDPVLPYVYASEVDDARVIAVIAEMAAGGSTRSPLQVRPRFDGSAMSHAPSVEKRNCGKVWNALSLRRLGLLLQLSLMRLECR